MYQFLFKVFADGKMMIDFSLLPPPTPSYKIIVKKYLSMQPVRKCIANIN
jgi:hypothetical protein